MKKLHYAIRTVFMAVALLFALSCGRHEEMPSTEFSTWIKAYSGRVADSSSPIKVVFTAPLDAGVLSGMEEKELEGLFTFSPAMKGTVRTSGTDALEFIPDEGEMKPGTMYNASLKLGKITDSDSQGLDVFRFSFTTAAKEAVMKVDEVIIPADSPETAKINGHITFSSPADAETAKGMLSCKADGQTAEIYTMQGNTGNSVLFTVSGLQRKDKASKIKLVFDGNPAGYASRQEKEVTIPAMNGFRIIGSKIDRSGTPFINVCFSQPLDETMDPKGLFELENAGKYYIDIKDNLAKIFYEKAEKENIIVRVAAGVRSADGQRLGRNLKKEFTDNRIKPAVTIPLKGNILPDASELMLPFRAVNLSAVDVSVIRIYENNILTFLQDNELDGDNGLRRSGRLICRKTVRLDGDPGKDLHKWQDFAVDLSGLFRQEAGAIYRIRLSFRPEYSLYGNAAAGNDGSRTWMTGLGTDDLSEEDRLVWDTPSPYYYESFYDWDKYEWKERDNPLHPSYYMVADRFPSCNLMTSNIGIISKSADGGKIWITVNDILTARPVKDAEVTVYNYQLQEIGKAQTDGDGFAEIVPDGKAFAITAKRGQSISYLKVTDGNEKPLSRFDTGGVKTEKGLKAFIYGERGVWRPGDTLHVSMVLEDRENALPDSHPVTMELYTPQGQFYSRMTDMDGMNGFHVFHIPTLPDDPTGTWNAYFKVGGSSFHKPLMIESIKPNRLKIELKTSDEVLQSGKKTRFDLASSWLTGPAASGLDCKVEMTLAPAGKTFKGYEGYSFSDPASTFTGTEMQVLEGRLDNGGRLSKDFMVPKLEGAPGMLRATLISRVSEAGGDESITSRTALFSPYDAYVGIKLPASDNGYIETDKDHSFPVIVTDKDGKPMSGHRVEYRIFKLDWSWWWESKAEELDSYVNGTAAKPYSTGSFTSSEKPYEIPFRLDYPEWGRFLVYVKDVTGGHASGGIIMVDWPAYRGRSDKKDPDALTMLTFATDKKEYKAGETATVFIPAAEGGMALVSLENGSRVISRNWVKTSGKEDTPFKFTVTPEMSPNFYIHISLLQKHRNTGNDLPVRMYGVQPVLVENEGSHLYPQLSMPDAVRPLEEFSIRVSEKEGRKMTYTLAIVDEGLLDLTAFKTPDPWNTMYAREALGVKTWDLYDDVIGAFGGKLVPLTGIGGDQTINKEAKQDNRFNAVVKYLGPFTLNGKENVHKVTLPMYVGSVRVMLVAGNEGAYGNAEKTVPVRTPLMVLPTLPRVLGQGENVTLPVNVFAMEKGVADVTVSVKAEGPTKVSGTDRTSIRFDGTGDTIVRFGLKTSEMEEGTAKVTVTATGGGYTASETVSVQVRNPNPSVTTLQAEEIAPGESREFAWQLSDGCSVNVGLAGFPSIDFNGSFSYLSEYQHSCTEQISAKGIALLSMKKLLSSENAAKADRLIPLLLDELYGRQLPDGGFAYWPGRASADEWVTSMAGHFMQLSEENGYEVNGGVMSAWKNFQKKCVRNWRNTGENNLYDLMQAYRLYTLALASSAETGAMNRMKEMEGLSLQSRWRLAAAYALTGKKVIALEMIHGLKTDVADYSISNVTYGSSLRDKAMILETMVLAGDMSGAVALAGEVADKFSSSGWYTTQNTAFTAAAMGRLAETLNTGAIRAEIVQTETAKVEKAASAYTAALDPATGKATVRNLSEGPLYVTLSVKSRPTYGTAIPASASGIEMNISWSDLDGNPVSPASLKQGTDFKATVTVSNISGVSDYTGLALTFPIPSGWEIFNGRMFNAGSTEAADGDYGVGSGLDSGTGSGSAQYDYMDIRDDRTMIYFDLPKGTRKKFTIRLRAAYEGQFIRPAVTCEQMYDPAVNACTGSGTAKVTR